MLFRIQYQVFKSLVCVNVEAGGLAHGWVQVGTGRCRVGTGRYRVSTGRFR